MKHNAWAINLHDEEYTGDEELYIGRYWLEEGFPPLKESVLRVRLFENRDKARAFLKLMKSKHYQAFPHARVERVEVTVRPLDD